MGDTEVRDIPSTRSANKAFCLDHLEPDARIGGRNEIERVYAAGFCKGQTLREPIPCTCRTNLMLSHKLASILYLL
jgi:hypothetical protein